MVETASYKMQCRNEYMEADKQSNLCVEPNSAWNPLNQGKSLK